MTKFEDLPELLSIAEFSSYTGIGKSTAYEMVRCGTITCLKFGRVIRIPKKECHS